MLDSTYIPRQIGLEIETVCGYLGSGGNAQVQENLAALFNANGLSAEARGYSHLPVNTDWAIETDSSLNFADCPYRGVNVASLEIKTRILRDLADFQTVVPKALELLRFTACHVNTSTSMHQHISIPEIRENPSIIRNLYNLIYKYQYVLFGLCPHSRLASQYCQPLEPPSPALRRARSLSQFRRAMAPWDRYKVVNFTHIFEDMPRVEFRLWSSTLNPIKALNTARLACGLIDHAVRRSVQSVEPLRNDRRSLESLLVSTGFKVNSGIYSKVSPDLRETGRWILRRWFEFNGKQPFRPKAKGISRNSVLIGQG